MPTIYKPKKSQKKNENNFHDAERRKVYNTERWRRLRAWKFACNPLCEMCLKDDKVVPAEDIHHVVSFMSTDDPAQRNFLAYDFDNLMSLCKQCHQRVHNSK
ncbi:HNH endonuclease signature motif containing protein [uncultured Bacteroides sp.]|uniref:HNH endonuclease signature motif containing protein n=1 Tax=uncultured Bacteroides sp. TaxID=162156 RepID=UPI00204C0448|nr:HNH endonuclease signature motif containing protein [uncultured Bacteroides sp.]DAJ86860.1 MAG TPA: HNH endonuclease [Caudoviricetes sp.]